MTAIALLLLAGDIFCVTTRQVAFKAASHSASIDRGAGYWVRLLRSPLLWIGIVSFVGEALFWLGFISVVPLSTAVMLGTLNIATVMIAGRIFFGDKITPIHAVAIALIAGGVVLVGLGGG